MSADSSPLTTDDEPTSTRLRVLAGAHGYAAGEGPLYLGADRIEKLETALRKAAIAIQIHSPNLTELLEEIEALLGAAQ